MRKYIIIFISMLFGSQLFAQDTTRFTAFIAGNWSDVARWDNGIPDVTDIVEIKSALSFNCTVDVTANCLDMAYFTTFGHSLNVQNGIVLTIERFFKTVANSAPITNNGEIIIKEGMFIDGNQRVEIGGSSIQFFSPFKLE